MNITYATLFPDLDGLAKSLAYELEFHWAYNRGPWSVSHVIWRYTSRLQPRGDHRLMSATRRSFFARAAAIATAQGLVLKGQQTTPPAAPVTHAPGKQYDPRMGTGNADKYFKYFAGRSKVVPHQGGQPAQEHLRFAGRD